MRIPPPGFAGARKRFRSPQGAVLLTLVLIAAFYLSLLPTSSRAASPALLSQGKPATASSVQERLHAAPARATATPAPAGPAPSATRSGSRSTSAPPPPITPGRAALGGRVRARRSRSRPPTNAHHLDRRSTPPPPAPAAPRRSPSPAPAATCGCTAPRAAPGTATRCGSSRSTARSGATRTAPAAPTNAALGKPATASSTENAGTPGLGRRRRQRRHPLVERVQRPAVAPGRPRRLSRRSARWSLNWEAAYATAYQIQVSDDGTTWTTVYSTTTGTGGTQTLTVTGTGRYVRMYGTARATAVRLLAVGVHRAHPRRRTSRPPPHRRRRPAAARGSAPPRRSPTGSRRCWRR